MGPAKDKTVTSDKLHPHLHLHLHALHNANKETEPSMLDSLGEVPVTVTNEDTQDDVAKPGKVFKDLLLYVPANIQARAHKYRCNRRMYLRLMRSVQPEHPRYAL